MISHNKPYQIYNILTKKSRCPQGIAGIRTLLNFGTQEGASVSDKGKIQNVLTVVTLPSTGGSGTKMIYAVEIALAAVAGFLFVLRRRLKNTGTA
jgi:LPXTG-motif cell wall-anchored protein